MHPILVQVGSIVIPTWHALFCVAALVAYALLQHLVRTRAPDMNPQSITSAYIAAYCGAYLGARLFAILVEEAPLAGFQDLFHRLTHLGAMTFYGGAIGAILIGGLTALRVGLSFPRLLDLGIVCGFVAVAIGRVGCFLNGDDYGIPVTPAFWSVTFPNDPDQVARVPVQLLESASAALLALVLFQILGKKRAGTVGALGIVGYATIRFGLEFLRGDPRGPSIAGLSPAQVVSLCVIVTTSLLAASTLGSRRCCHPTTSQT